jgi:hypothetical protein
MGQHLAQAQRVAMLFNVEIQRAAKTSTAIRRGLRMG